jgi:hypothetical protein
MIPEKGTNCFYLFSPFNNKILLLHYKKENLSTSEFSYFQAITNIKISRKE